MAGYDRLYFLKKAWPLFPGVVRPISGGFLAAHYRRRTAGRGPLLAVADALTGLAFRAWIPWRAAKVARKFGLDAAWRARAIAIAQARFADPNDIALFRIDSADELDAYVRRFEDAALNKAINPRGWTDACVLADKGLFATRCRSAGLPHAETIATVENGEIRILDDPAGRELVAKPVRGEGGDGVRMLGAVPDGDALTALLRGQRGPVLVQPLVRVHPSISYLALNALPTVRIVTILDENGAPEVVSATFRCPSKPEARVDNMKAGGLISAVALDDGTLGTACLGYGGGDHDVHPTTGALITGRPLPDWQAATALVIRAHQDAFADYILIGWDVALTPEGPLLIEGNGKPGVLMPQRAARQGLGATRYGLLYAHHLASSSGNKNVAAS
jgi:hypothetical protein